MDGHIEFDIRVAEREEDDEILDMLQLWRS